MLKIILGNAFYKFKLFKYRNFDKGREIKKLHNKFSGKRCFIIGNGPSLKAKDLDMLKDEYTFAFNKIYYIFDDTEWRPSFYMSEDEEFLINHSNEVSNVDLPFKFINNHICQKENIIIKDAIYYNLVFKWQNSALPPFSENFFKEVVGGNTVTYSAIQFAYYMGFSEIYLLGIDHTFSVTKNDAGEVKYNNNVKDYFSEKYKGDSKIIPNVEKSNRAYLAAENFAKEHGIKILNATRGGALEVFERVDFDSLF